MQIPSPGFPLILFFPYGMWGKKYNCTGSDWDGASFLHSSSLASVFRFRTKTMLVTHWCFGYCSIVLAASRSSLFLTLPPQWAEKRCPRRWEGAQPRRPNKPKRYSKLCNIRLSNEQVKKKETAIFCLGTGWILTHSSHAIRNLCNLKATWRTAYFFLLDRIWALPVFWLGCYPRFAN